MRNHGNRGVIVVQLDAATCYPLEETYVIPESLAGYCRSHFLGSGFHK
jgi:hypothetical protein